MTKKLGSDPFKKTGVNSLIKDTRRTAKQQASITVKATYYIKFDNLRGLKHLSVDISRDYSDLINEAIELLLKKYKV